MGILGMMGFTQDDEPHTFPQGAGVLIETAEGGLEIGDFIGAGDYGIMLRATHRLQDVELEGEEREEVLGSLGLTEEDEDGEVEATRQEMVPLAKSVLTFLPWAEVRKIELAEDYYMDAQLRDFREQLDIGTGGELVDEDESSDEDE